MLFVDFDALKRNANYFRTLVAPSRLCAVVKNNAYGHGLIHIARHLAPYVHMFAVGSVDEAEQIAFLNVPVLILLPQNQRNTERAAKQGFELTVDSFETLSTVEHVCKRENLIADVHIKIDSGMSRLGFVSEDIPLLVERLDCSPIRVSGIFSHFYGETMQSCDKQLACFLSDIKPLKKAFPKALCHIANTSATLLSPKYRLDMVRVGLGLFGYGSGALVPVKTVVADVVSVKRVRKGSVVGYGAKYVCPNDTQIAVLNIGYAMGLNRTLVGGKIKIGDGVFPIAAICMAMTMVDVGEADVQVGEKAVLMGNGVDISNEQVIVYELLCNLR